MAANVTVIGRAARVRGRVSGEGDVEVLGFVEGEMSAGGDITIDAGGLVAANVRGRRVVVRGAVKGDISAAESIALEDGARVVGDLRASRIAIAHGALVRGHVETGDSESAKPPVTRAQSVARGGPAVVRAAAPAPARAAAVPSRPPGRDATVPASVEVSRRAAPAREQTSDSPANPSPSPAAPRRPPPPVVPAMKKLRGQILKKKER